MNDPNSTSTRREFARNALLVAAAPLVSPDDKKDQQKPADPKPQAAASVPQLLTEIVRVRYGKFLNEEQMEAVKKSLEGDQQGLEKLKQFKLKNSDEPAFAFTADIL